MNVREREAQRRDLLQRQQRQPSDVTLNPDSVLADLQERLSHWHSLLHDQAPRARRLLKQLIVGRLQMMTPHRDEGYYTLNGTGTLLPVIADAVPQSVASLTTVSWNRISSWLKQIDNLRQAA